ncbi:MAG TPA: peptidase T [Lachnospiraceae bacterium]|nr:peptidase T [Lachnospiraceae bacterium]
MSLVTDLFLQYVKIDTESNENSHTTPSTLKQHDLAKLLVKQLQDMKAEEITYDKEHCYVYATIPATKGAEDAPVLGFLAHMDTAPAMTGKNVTPRIITSYDGNDILLNPEKNIYMKKSDFPELQDYMGKDLIVTDGTTLLGADDKSGVAEIMAMCNRLLKEDNHKHGKIRIGFTPDEEIGAGSDYFDVALFGADYAYTVDGEKSGELQYENFNAAGAKVIAHGLSVHPGDAKNKMKNAILLLQEFQSMLPVQENPMYTEGYEGFYHLDAISGTVEEACSEYIIRDHSAQKFQDKKERFLLISDFLNKKYGEGSIRIEMKDSYRNMKEMIEKNMHLIDNAKLAMKQMGINPKIQPVRGGTDGARLSFMGLPCPNLGTGGGNCHGKFEYACIQDMERNVDLLIRITEIYGDKTWKTK